MAKMDLAHRETDKLIEDLERRIREEYARASVEMHAKLDTYMRSFERKDEAKKKLVESGQMTKTQYKQWRTGQIMIGKRWEEMSRTLATDLANTDKIAQSITRGYMAEAYALNHNYGTFEVEKASMVDTSYTLYDRHTVENLIKTQPTLLPPPTPGGKTDRELREGKLIKWNQQALTSEVTQSILQGESVDKIANRILPEINAKTNWGMVKTDKERNTLLKRNENAAMRNARTMMTGAQNAGRQRSYERAQDMGILGGKQWLAAMDGRTRHWHVELDGETVPVKEMFVNEYGEIEYPGDAGADPANVYNCRCTMIYVLDGFEKEKQDWLESRHNDELGDMTWSEWKKMHAEKQAKHGYVRAEKTKR